MNKFELMNKVLMSDLKPEDKCLLQELILRADDSGLSWPSVERLCKARGIKHEKNFKGADVYLPGLVTKEKRGRKNLYRINTPAVEGLLDAEVTIKHTNTPAVEGVYTPAVEGVSEANTPAVADNTPAVEGANSSSNNTTTDNTKDSSMRSAPVKPSLSKNDSIVSFDVEEPAPVFDEDSTERITPATEGVLDYDAECRAHQRKWGAKKRATGSLLQHEVRQMVREQQEIDDRHGIEGW